MALIPSARKTITIGGTVFTDIANLIQIAGYHGSTNTFMTLRKLDASSGYAPSGKSYYMVAARAMTTNSGVTAKIFPLYGDTDVGFDSASAPTNPVYPASGATKSTTPPLFILNDSDGINQTEFSFKFVIPDGKYPGFTSGASGAELLVQVFGYEV